MTTPRQPSKTVAASAAAVEPYYESDGEPQIHNVNGVGEDDDYHNRVTHGEHLLPMLQTADIHLTFAGRIH